MIKVLRVDDRLLHGQVAVSCVNHLKVDTILIANDALIQDKTMRIAFELAKPAGVVLSMKSLEGAIAVINNPKHESRNILVITKTIQDAKYLCDKTDVKIKEILLGGLRSGEGKKQIDMNSYMSKDDIEVMNQLVESNRHVYMQQVPGAKILEVVEINKIFNK
ncbi:MAG: PTS sugar transporter subunit IIB [Erysipelotrichaceae bacterium]|nr:PTS sugar transporter subunit IIB [Erysipelotrichaceae bacterium]MDY5252748.1 PTS sugar transporter subunit IIB [Erysipelotrichaceae bacterium]